MSRQRRAEYLGLDMYAGVDDGTPFGHYARLLAPEFNRIIRWLTRRLEPGERPDGAGYYPTDRQAQAFRLRVAGYNITEIANMMDIDRKTARAHLMGALNKLKRLKGVGMFTVIVEALGPEAGADIMGESNWHWYAEQVRMSVMANRADSPATRQEKKGPTD